jgi:anti-sigma regulatory factor (Ser/Thr protein kinase)
VSASLDAPVCAHGHVVGVYRRDDELIAALAPFLAESLERGGAALVVATPARREALEAALEARGLSVASLTASGRFESVNASAMLRAFVREGRIDPVEFAAVAGEKLSRVEAAGGPVHVFGEMVGLLWDAGDVAAAIELEGLWNDLAARHAFALFCAYAMASLETSGDLVAVKQMCDRHSAVVPLDDCASEGADGGIAADLDQHDRIFVGAPAALRDVRRFVRDILRAWGEDPLDGALEVVTSELATNAVQHARSPFRVSISRGPAGIRVAVRDTSRVRPAQVSGNRARPGGRGVRLVAALSASWGVVEEHDGKTVWAEVERSAPDA